MTRQAAFDHRCLLGTGVLTAVLLVASQLIGLAENANVLPHLSFALACYGGLAAALACGRMSGRLRTMGLALAVVVSVGLDLVLVLAMPDGGEPSSLAAGRTALATAAIISYIGVIGWSSSGNQPGYPAFFSLVSGTVVEGIIALVLSGFAWLLLLVLIMMLPAIGLGALSNLTNSLVWSVAIPMTLAMFLLGLRRRPALADALRQQLLTIVGRLQLVVVAIALIFLAAFALRALDGQALGTVPAAAVLGLACCWLVTLNATWQGDGNTHVFSAAWLRVLRLSVLALPVLVALALGGLIVRIDAHGWTPTRIWILVLTLALLAAGLGYAWGAIKATRWQRRRAGTNIAVPLAAVVAVVALSAPGINVVRLAPAVYVPPYVLSPPGAMPSLTALPPGSTPDASLWDYLRNESPWAAHECIEALNMRAAGNLQADCIMFDLATWGGHGPLIAFWPLTNYQPHQISVYGRLNGGWERVAGVSLVWLASTGHLPDHVLNRDADASASEAHELAKPAAEVQ